MIKKGMNILPLPKVIFKHGDQENASQFLGKTAYYSPSDMTVVLYTEGRHPKDIVRSFAHEMVHHIQNLEDRLENISTTNTMEDDNLNDIEREAYTRGNMAFRNWTDSLDGEEVSSLNEDENNLTFYHGGLPIDFTISDIDPFRKAGRQSKKGKDYAGFYMSPDLKPNSFALGYHKNKPGSGLHKIILDKDSKAYEHDGEMERISTLELKSLLNKGYDYIKGKNLFGKPEFILLNKKKATLKLIKPNSIEYKTAIKNIKEEVTSLNEKIVGEKIECDNCGWSWNIVDGGDDLYMCHKCGHDNEPESGDPFGLKAYARELMEDFNIEDIKPATKSLEEQERVRIFNPNCGCDKT